MKKKTVAHPEEKMLLWLSLPLIVAVMVCSVTGLVNPDIYSRATANWLAQTVAQDAVNLFLIVPVLAVAALYSFQGIKVAYIMWAGTVTYIVYTYLIYCFAVPFNSLFLAYCFVLGLSIFSLAWFTIRLLRDPNPAITNSVKFMKTSGIYFIVIALFFYALWYAEILPSSISGTVPDSLAEVGLLTNPVHVIDLSIFLPLVFITGIGALSGRLFAGKVVPVLLTFFFLMDVTISAIAVVLQQNGLGSNLVVAIVMGVLALFSLGCLTWYVRVVE